jgi:hypothetical protein
MGYIFKYVRPFGSARDDAVERENTFALVDPACMVCHMALDTSGSTKEGTIST